MGDVYRYECQLRFSDCDGMRHVNNSRFLSYLEDARVTMLGLGPRRAGEIRMQGAIVARIEIDYLKPIHLSSDPLLVELWVSRIGTSSFDIDYRIVQDGEDAAHAKSVIVTYDYESGRSRPMNDDERGLLDKYVITVDA